MRLRSLLLLVLCVSTAPFLLRSVPASPSDAEVTRTGNLQHLQLVAGNADVARHRNLQYHQLESGNADATRLQNLQYFELADIAADVIRYRNLQFFELCAQLRVDPPRQKAAHRVTFPINVNVSEVTDLYSFEFKLQYDPTLLKATEVTLGSFLNPPATIVHEEINQTLGFVWFSASSVAPAPPASGSGVLATITFTATPGGNSVLQLLDIQLLNPASEAIENQAINGFFECIPVWGDTNGDHIVDVFDLFALGKAYGSTLGEPNWNPTCDLNDDGMVDWPDLFVFNQNYGKTWDP